MTVLPGLWSDVEIVAGHALLRLRGALRLATVPRARRLLDKALRDPGAVVADLAELRLEWPAAVEVFPAALAAAGGWPTARLVLTGAAEDTAATLRSLAVDRTVPVAPDHAAAAACLARRPERVARHRDLESSPYAPAMARALVREACTDWSVAAAADAAALVMSELVTGVVRHGGSGCRVSVSVDRSGLRITVRHHAPGRALRPRPVDVRGGEGRGLHLVAVLASAWGVREQADGTTAWALFALAA